MCMSTGKHEQDAVLYKDEEKSEWAGAAFGSTGTEMFRKMASRILK